MSVGLDELLGNLATLLVIAALAVIARKAVRPAGPPPASRPLVALAGFGAALTLLGALLVSLAAAIQHDGPAPGGGCGC